eukprot:1732451-Rhodomonas_salina.2
MCAWLPLTYLCAIPERNKTTVGVGCSLRTVGLICAAMSGTDIGVLLLAGRARGRGDRALENDHGCLSLPGRDSLAACSPRFSHRCVWRAQSGKNQVRDGLYWLLEWKYFVYFVASAIVFSVILIQVKCLRACCAMRSADVELGAARLIRLRPRSSTRPSAS